MGTDHRLQQEDDAANLAADRQRSPTCRRIHGSIAVEIAWMFNARLLQCGPSNYSYLRTIDHSEIGVMCTN